MTGKQVIALLKENGRTPDRVNGSHHVMTKPGRRSVPVPVHGSEDLGPLAKRILREAGIEQ